MKFIRKCPKCSKDILYSRKDSLKRAIDEERNCYDCSIIKGDKHYRFGKHCSNTTKQKISKTKTGVPIHSDKHRKTLSEKWKTDRNPSKSNPSFLGKKHTKETKEKMSKSRMGKNYGLIGENHPMFGRKHSEETKIKLRLAKIKSLEKLGKLTSPNYNPIASEFFRNLESINGWDGYYAPKNKEYYIKGLGYWVDYYEPNLNIVIEYDEKHHFRDNRLKDKDIERMINIIKLLKCQFTRYNSVTSELIDYTFYPSTSTHSTLSNAARLEPPA